MSVDRAAAAAPFAGLALRPLSLDDAAALHALAQRPALAYWEPRAPHLTLDARRAWLEVAVLSRHLLAAWVGDTLVGWAELTPGRYRRAHVASLSLVVHDDWQRRGIGRALLLAMLDLADRWLGLRRLEATLYADNEAASALLCSAGFEMEVRQRGFALRDEGLVDGCLMARLRAPMPVAAEHTTHDT
jgi:putative acetyltransferase